MRFKLDWRVGLVAAWIGWTLLCLLLASQGADQAAAAHLWIIASSLPVGLITLLLPHGSSLALVVAGILGCAQWYALLAFASRMSR